MAVIMDFKHIAKQLLTQNFPLDLQTKVGMTVMHLASFHGRLEIVKIILDYIKKKDDPELKNKVFNKVNHISHLSPLSYSIMFTKNENNEKQKDECALYADIPTSPTNEKGVLTKELIPLSSVYKRQMISELLIEAGAQCYYDETGEAKDFSPIFMAV